MKKALTILFVLFSFTQSFAAKGDIPSVLQGLKQTVNNVDYLAKVNITNVEILFEDDESEKHVYFAQVLETYKGDVYKQIRYEMFVDQGENVVFNSTPIYIALCLDSNGTYYWPGTGSEFKYSLELDTWLTKNKSKLENTSASTEWCK